MENDDKSKKSFFSRHKYWIIPLAIVLGIVLFLVTGSILLFVIYFIFLYISYRYLAPEAKEKGFMAYAKDKAKSDIEGLRNLLPKFGKKRVVEEVVKIEKDED